MAWASKIDTSNVSFFFHFFVYLRDLLFKFDFDQLKELYFAPFFNLIRINFHLRKHKLFEKNNFASLSPMSRFQTFVSLLFYTLETSFSNLIPTILNNVFSASYGSKQIKIHLMCREHTWFEKKNCLAIFLPKSRHQTLGGNQKKSYLLWRKDALFWKKTKSFFTHIEYSNLSFSLFSYFGDLFFKSDFHQTE